MSIAFDLARVSAGFADPTRESQRVFRKLMDAMARPGTIHDLSQAPDAPAGLHRAAGAVALTLFDFETPIWLDPVLHTEAVEGWLQFHCGAPRVADPQGAAFALLADLATAPRLADFNAGDAKYPDRSTTLVIQLPSLEYGPSVTLTGPGIKSDSTLNLGGLRPGFWAEVQDNHARFQFGVDFIFVAGNHLTALPRSTRVVA